MNVQEQALQVIANVMEVAIEEITLEMAVDELPEWDSFVQVQMLSDLADKNILQGSIEEVVERMGTFHTVRDWLNELGIHE
ncbi:hypothetical protein AGMMS4952_21330 [Spirochaetia bacterium]|nr:hypothetical protein AGMMS4952_21330 [Spirochaetia bacterium]